MFFLDSLNEFSRFQLAENAACLLCRIPFPKTRSEFTFGGKMRSTWVGEPLRPYFNSSLSEKSARERILISLSVVSSFRL
jgi:hypothetical protein